jgi:cysteine dioxygenase
VRSAGDGFDAMTKGGMQLDHLCTDLDRHLSEDPRGSKVASWLENYARRGTDWRKYALFDATYYARNLVHRTELFELIVLCWSPGQRSPIHDHTGQRCWMGVLDGVVRETLYGIDDGGSRALPGQVRRFDRGSVAYIVDDMGWHRIEPIDGSAAVTLHLYSRPIAECRIFDETTSSIVNRKMAYHSVGGRVTAQRV